MNFKHIHIGKFIHAKFQEQNIDFKRACIFIKCTEQDIKDMFLQENISSDILLKWSKLLEYDFFRIYSNHLILYAPPSSSRYNKNLSKEKSVLPEFRKNIYTKEMIDFILELIKSGKKDRNQIINDYKIPKTTLYKWIKKYMEEE